MPFHKQKTTKLSKSSIEKQKPPKLKKPQAE